jgi:phosphoglycerate dehydrogenase-like enzyme
MPVIHVHMLDTADDADAAFLAPLLDDEISLTEGPDVPAATQILIGGLPTREQLASPRVTSLIIPWVGLPGRTRKLLDDFPHVQVHNLHYNAPMVAEMAVALLLAAAKFVVPFDQALRRDDWGPRYEPAPSVLLSGRTGLVLGYGEIGRRVAKVCRALGMTVLGTRLHPQATDGIAHEVHASFALADLLPRAQALVVCLPLTPETKGMIGKDQLALLPPDAVVVNIGRGPIVDEGALYAALRDRHIAAAGLDVWYNYPTDEQSRAATPPSRYPFGELDNVVMSPHRGGSVVETEQLRAEALAEMLRAAVAGKPLPNPVNLDLGY